MTGPGGAAPDREVPDGADPGGGDPGGAPPDGNGRPRPGGPAGGRSDVFAPWATPGGRREGGERGAPTTPAGGGQGGGGTTRAGGGRQTSTPGPAGDGHDRPAEEPRTRPPGEPGRDEGRGAAATDAARRSLLFTLLVLCALVASRLPGLWASVGLAFTATAMVVGGLAVAAAWTARRRGTVAVMGGGLALAAFVLLTQVAQLVVHPFQAELRACLASAVTVETRTACEEADRQRMTERLEGLGGAGSSPG